jgi:hypothetical protein
MCVQVDVSRHRDGVEGRCLAVVVAVVVVVIGRVATSTRPFHGCGDACVTVMLCVVVCHNLRLPVPMIAPSKRMVCASESK